MSVKEQEVDEGVVVNRKLQRERKASALQERKKWGETEIDAQNQDLTDERDLVARG